MSGTSGVAVTLGLTDSRALAPARLVKRLTWTDAQGLSITRR